MRYNKYKLYLYFCMSAFFLILAVTLFYSFGYHYDPDTGKSFQVGAIVLKVIPRDATITKDDEKVEQGGFLGGMFSTFTKIESLEARSYDIKVSKDGYNEWQKKVQINAGQVKKFENVVLLKKEYAKQQAFGDITLPDAKKIWSNASKNKVAFYGTVADKEGLYIVNMESEDWQMILDKTQMSLMGEIQETKWTEDDGKIIVNAGGNMYIVDLQDNGKTYLISANIAKLLGQDKIVYGIYDRFIVYSQNGMIYSFNYISKENKKLLEGTSSFYEYEGNIYFFKAGETGNITFFSVSIEDPAQETRVGRMPQGYDASAGFTIQKHGDYTILLANDSLYLINKDSSSKKINSNVKKAQFFQGGKRILYSNDNEIWIYYTENKTSQPIKTKDENELLIRLSSKISNIYLYSDEEHIFFQESGALRFTEMDGRDNRNTCKVLENPDGQNIFYVRGKNIVYGTDNSKIYKIDLKEE